MGTDGINGAQLDLLVLAAFEPELAAIADALGGNDARVGDLAVALRLTGVGLAAAAVGATRHVGELAPRAVVLVGSCGAYTGTRLTLGDVVVSERLTLVDPSSLEGKTEFPPPMATSLEADAALALGLVTAGGRACSVATTLAITVDDPLAARIASSTGVEVEHLETHGVALACAALRAPFAAVLGVANMVGALGRRQWLAHHREAEAAAGAQVLRWLRAGAPGFPARGGPPR